MNFGRYAGLTHEIGIVTRRENGMTIANKTVLITGANRGIGRALVDDALRRGAKRVYAGTRAPMQGGYKRVTPLTLDVTNVAQILRAVDEIDTLDILISNTGVAS
jgi:NAD(P)-dependent dehydrogenase (short-subunit alcohol dehydrogenase family)